MTLQTFFTILIDETEESLKTQNKKRFSSIRWTNSCFLPLGMEYNWRGP